MSQSMVMYSLHLCHTTPTKVIEFNLCLICFGNKHAINNFNQKTIIITSVVLEQRFGAIWYHYTPGSDGIITLPFSCVCYKHMLSLLNNNYLFHTQVFLVQIKNIIIDKKLN